MGKQKPVPKNDYLLAAGGLMGRKHLSLDPCLALTKSELYRRLANIINPSSSSFIACLIIFHFPFFKMQK